MKIKHLLVMLLLLSLLFAGCEPYEPYDPISPTVSDSGALTVHFIDVGQADCILLESDGQFMLIDGGNREDSSLVVSYLEQQGVQTLEAVVCTHAHEDHVGGLPGVLAVFPTKAVYSPTKTYASNIYDKFLYYVDQQGLEVTLPVSGTVLTLGDAQITILGPLKSYAETNNTSIVLKAVYGETSFLFTGDMEQEAEHDLLEAGLDLKADVLKVGHHGSHTSTGYRFLYEVEPTYAVISVGTGNDYGHPHKETLELYEDAGLPMLRTDALGTVLAVSDGREVTLTWEKQQSVPMNLEPAEGFGKYIANKNSKTLHTPFCSGLPKEANRIYYDSYEAAMADGCKPCTGCIG